RVKGQRLVWSQDAANTNIRNVVVVHPREHVIGRAALEIEVQRPDPDWLRFEPEDKRVGAVVDFFKLGLGYRSDGNVTAPKFDMSVGVPVAGMNRKPTAYVVIAFNRIQESPVLERPECERVGQHGWQRGFIAGSHLRSQQRFRKEIAPVDPEVVNTE